MKSRFYYGFMPFFVLGIEIDKVNGQYVLFFDAFFCFFGIGFGKVSRVRTEKGFKYPWFQFVNDFKEHFRDK